MSRASTSSAVSSTTSKTVDKVKHVKKKTNKMDSFIDKISKAEIDEVNDKLSNFFFGCNIPLQVVESDHFKKFVESLRPSYKLPGRKLLSTTLLDRSYQKCKDTASAFISDESVLLIDGWKNTSSNAKTVVSMIHNAKGGQAFVDAWDLTGESETGDKLAEIVNKSAEIAMRMYNTTIYAVVSDNAAAMLKMGRSIDIWHSNCSSHTANLLAKDVLDTELTRKVHMVLKEFKLADFERALVDSGGSRIKTPVDTRWCTYRDSYECLIKNVNKMRMLIVSDGIFKKIKPAVKNLLFDDDFIEEVKDNIKLFDPICEIINIAQKSETSIAEIVNYWIKVKLPPTFSKFDEKLDARKKMALNVYALCAYYLHPKYHSEANNLLSTSQKIKIQSFLIENLPEEGINGLSDFQENSGIFATLYLKNVQDPITFWNMAKLNYKSLAVLALKLQNLPASSAQIERIFSNWSYVHSPIRNKLTFERSKKLLNVYYTLKCVDTNKTDEY